MATKTTAFTGPVVVGLNDKKGEIRLTDGKNVNEAKYLSIAAPDNITSDTTLTFPDGAGTAGQILSTDGNGGLSWVNDSAGNPAGTNGQVQTNDGGTFGAISEGSSGQVLTSNGAGVAPTFQNATGGGIAAVVDDTSPELGGNLDLNGNDVTGASLILDNTNNRIGINTTSPSRALTIAGGSDAKIQFKEGGTQSLYFGDSGSDFAGFINYNHSDNRMKISASDTVELQSSAADITLTDKVRIQNSYNLPDADGTAGQVMTTDGSGNVTFQSAGSAPDPITSSLDVDTGKTIRLNANYPTGATTNVIMGENALTGGSISGGLNTVIGSAAGNNSSLTNGARTTIVGANSGSGSGASNTIVGADVLQNNVYGQNTVVGARAVTNGQNVQRCVAMGYEAGFSSDATNDNTIIGYQAHKTNTTGVENVVIGSKAMNLGDGGDHNIAIGTEALENGGNQIQNIAIGYRALNNMSGGFQNVAVGDEAMNSSVNAWGSVAIGDSALPVAEGIVNVAIGQSAGNNISTGAQNICIGRSAGNGLTTGDNNIIIGSNAVQSSNTISNEITLGNPNITTLRCQQTSITSLSDARDKKDVEDLNVGLDVINDLRPVKFVWDTRDGAIKDVKEFGFIAQELDEVQQKHGIEDSLRLVLKNNPDKLEAAPGKLIPILVQAIKDLKKEIDELKKA